MLSKILTSPSIQAFSTNLVKLKINDKDIEVPKGTCLYDAIEKAGYTVPKMCYHPDLPTSGGICRICVVEDKKKPGQPIISCKQKVSEGMDIDTRTEKMMEYRRTNTALMFSYHPSSCIKCANTSKCEARSVCGALDIVDSPMRPVISKYDSKPKVEHVGKSAMMEDDFSSNIVKIKDLCINCDRCIQACEYLEGIGVYGWVNDKESGHSVGAFGPAAENECIECGQCINRCPVGALVEKSEIEQVLKAIKDPKKKVVFQTAPAIRVAIAEEFGYKPGEKMLKNELVEGLKKLGDNVYVVDTDFSADLTILEEGTELLGRLKKTLVGEGKGKSQKESALPLVTSCSPGWIKYMEKNYSDFKHKISTCKSPQQMMGAVIKGYWSKVKNWDPKDIVSVSIMPCTAKKYEKSRPEMEVDGYRDVDNVLTTREVAKMLKLRNIDISKLEGVPYDGPLGVSTGAAVIFGATGGVMEAALRTAYEIVVGEEVPFPKLNILPVRGMEGVREAAIPIPKTTKDFEFLKGATLKVAVAHGTINAAKLLDKLRECDEKGEAYPWHFIEIMACPGGCLGGGGQPKPTIKDARLERAKLIYQEDSDLPLRKSHDNPEVMKLYKDWLEKPNSHVAHKYLHTHYYDRTVDYSKYVDMSKSKEISAYLAKFEKKRADLVVEMLLGVTDQFGYVSDCAVVEIAKHAGIKPISVLSTASGYMYFPLEPVGDNTFYICQCRNCQMKGAKELQGKMEKLLKCKMGENSADGKYSLRHANWLGWCVNDAPAMMLKQKGSEKVIPILGSQSAKPKLSKLLKLPAGLPQNNIKLIPAKNKNNVSFFAPIDLKQAVNKAMSMSADEALKHIDASGLQGRGGAGFPTGTKWKSCKKERNPEKYVVVNIDEGLPSTFKDWVLLIDEANRQKMIAGMCICAKTIGATNAVLYLRYEYRNLTEDLYKSIKEVQAMHPEFAKVKFQIRLGGGPYVAGEGSALFESIEGKGARPRKDKLRSTTSGLYGKPTVINNVETFIAVPIILNIGGQVWGENKGANGEKGIKLYGMTGDINQPVIIEQTLGTNLNDLMKEAGISGIEAAEIGGTTERIALKKEFNEPIGFKKATFNGVGSIVLLNASRNLTKVYEDKMHFMMEESCQQCVPCRDGSKVLYEAVKNHNQGGKKISENIDYLTKIAECAEATSICAHGKAVGSLFYSVAEHLMKEEKNKK